MQKGISTIIATLLMLVMTIALAGIAYSYISGTFTARASKQIAAIDASCKASTAYYVTVRNLDSFTNVSTSEIALRVDDGPVTTVTWDTTTLVANGGIATATITNPAGGAASSAHRVRIIGPANSEQLPAYC